MRISVPTPLSGNREGGAHIPIPRWSALSVRRFERLEANTRANIMSLSHTELEELSMDKCLAERLEAGRAQIGVLIAGVEAICLALPQGSARVALASLTRRACELADTKAGLRDEAQLQVLAPLLSALRSASSSSSQPAQY